MKLLDNITEKLDNKYITLFAIVIGAFFLRLYRLTFEGLWTDEMAAVYTSNPDVSLRRMYNVLHFWDQTPPLYPLMLRYWFQITGFTDYNARLFSVIGGTLSLIAVFYLIKELYNRRTALFITLLVAITPYHIYFSREARSYIWAFLSVTMLLLFFYRQLKRYSNGYNRWLFILSGGILLQISYFSFFVHAALVAVVVLTFMLKKEKVDLKNWIIDYVFIGIQFLPWAYQFVKIFGMQNGGNGTSPSPMYLFEILNVFTAGVAGGFLLSIAFAVLLVLFVYLVWFQKKLFKNEYLWITALVLFFIIFVLFYLKSVSGRNILNGFMYSYVIVMYPVFLILLGGILYLTNRMLVGVLLLVFITANAIHFTDWYHLSFEKKKTEAYREMADFISKSENSKAPIVCAADYLQDFYYTQKNMQNQLISLSDFDKKLDTSKTTYFWIIDSYDYKSELILAEAKKRFPVRVVEIDTIKPPIGHLDFRELLIEKTN